MESFWKYLEYRLAETAEIPVPPDVDPGMWANPSYQKFWLAQNPEYLQQLQGKQPAVATAVTKPSVLGGTRPVARALRPATAGVPADTRYTKVPQDFYDKWKREYDRLPQDVLKWFTEQGFTWGSISGRPGTHRWMAPPNYPMPRTSRM